MLIVLRGKGPADSRLPSPYPEEGLAPKFQTRRPNRGRPIGSLGLGVWPCAQLARQSRCSGRQPEGPALRMSKPGRPRTLPPEPVRPPWGRPGAFDQAFATKFTALEDMSGTSFGKRLDLRAIGPTASPWSLPVCPKDHFVLLKQKFSPEELADLRRFVNSEPYQTVAADNL